MTDNTQDVIDAPVAGLLPCPFCGKDPEWRWHAGDALWIECKGCSAIGPQAGTTFETQEETIAGWNTRSQDPNREAEPISAEGLDAIKARLETARAAWLAAPSGIAAQAAGEAYGRVAIDATYSLIAAAAAAAATQMREALENIADITRRKQLPITNEINNIATAALTGKIS